MTMQKANTTNYTLQDRRTQNNNIDTTKRTTATNNTHKTTSPSPRPGNPVRHLSVLVLLLLLHERNGGTYLRMILLAVRYVQNVRHPGGDDTKTTPENKRLQHQWKNKEWGGKNTAGCKGLQILCNPPALAINCLLYTSPSPRD